MPVLIPAASTFAMAVATVGIQKAAILATMTIMATFVAKAMAKKPASYRSSQSDRTQTIRSTIESRKIVYGQTRLSGPLVFAHSTGEDNRYAHLIITYAAHEIESFDTIYFDDQLSTETSSTYYRINEHLGDTDQVADSDLVSEASTWTTAHRLRGVAYLYARLRYNRDAWPIGLPNISAIISGKNDIYDPRDSSTGYTNNAALCIRDYLLSDLGLNLSEDDIDDDSFIAAANICDEDVDLDAVPTTQKRYTLDGVVDTEYTPYENLEAMLTSCAGRLAFPGGIATIKVGAYEAPTFDLDEDNLRGSINVQAFNSRSKLFNTVRGVYTSQDETYMATDFPEVTNATYMAEDGGSKLYNDIDLPFTTDAIRAQRMAKIVLEEHRQSVAVKFPANLSPLDIIAGQTGNVSISDLGWTDKVFRADKWTYSPNGVDLVLREISSSMYSWAYGEATIVDTAPNTSLASSRTCSQISSLTLDSGTTHLDISGDGAVVSRILASWDAPNDSFVIRYEVEYKRSIDLTWKPAGSPGSHDDTQCYVSPVSDGVTYDVRVRAVNIVGVTSDWVTESNHSVIGKTEPPSSPNTFIVDRLPDGTRKFSWTHINPDNDVRSGGGYQIRYVAGSSGSWDSMSDLHTGLLSFSPFETNELDAGTWTFAIKSVDASGNECDSAVFINNLTLDSPRMGSAIYTEYPHSFGWVGTKTDCFVDENNFLIAESSGDWDDLTTWTAWSSFSVSPESPIVYEHTTIDLGAVVSFTPYITVVCDGTVTVTIDTSDDDSTYNGWEASGSPVSCRYLKVRISVAGSRPIIYSASIFLSADSIGEDINDLDISTLTGANRIATGDVRLPMGESYNTITQVKVTLQNVGGGWSWELIDKNVSTGPRIKIYNSTPTLADATIDAEIKGY